MTETTTERPTIGWVGAGRMGLQLATRLVNAGYPVLIFNRTASKLAPILELGATAADSPAALATSDVVCTMVSGSADLVEVCLGDRGVLTGDHQPRVLVDCSTVSVDASAQVREAAAARGVGFLAAPISGNPKVVRAGRASIAVSGAEADYERVRDVIGTLAPSVTYVGTDEVARLVKLCHNLFLGVVIQSLSEITLLAEQGGASRAAFLDFLNNSVMGSTFTRYKSPALVNLDFTPTFTMPLLRKDFDLGLAAARQHEVPMPLAALTAQLVASAVGAGHVDEDFAALILEQARRSGVTLKPENVPVDDGLGQR
jgi:3-hydroxyisobutyrate dehydrogenase-like beta-hydroxyacid dehydrogenase